MSEELKTVYDGENVPMPEVEVVEPAELPAVNPKAKKKKNKKTDAEIQVTQAFARVPPKNEAIAGFYPDENDTRKYEELSVQERFRWMNPSFVGDPQFAADYAMKYLGDKAVVADLSDSLGIGTDEVEVLLQDFVSRHHARDFGLQLRPWTRLMTQEEKDRENALNEGIDPEDPLAQVKKELADTLSANIEDVGFDKEEGKREIPVPPKVEIVLEAKPEAPDVSAQKPMTENVTTKSSENAHAQKNEVIKTKKPSDFAIAFRICARSARTFVSLVAKLGVSLYHCVKRTLFCALIASAAFVVISFGLQILGQALHLFEATFTTPTQVAVVDRTDIQSLLLEAAQTKKLEDLQDMKSNFDAATLQTIARLAQEQNVAVFKSEALLLTDGIHSLDMTESVKDELRRIFAISPVSESASLPVDTEKPTANVNLQKEVWTDKVLHLMHEKWEAFRAFLRTFY